MDFLLTDDIKRRQESSLRTIGKRVDTVCKECFHTGHDTRSLSCPAHKLRVAIQEGTLRGFTEAQTASQDIRDALAVQDGLPENLKAKGISQKNLAGLQMRFMEAWAALDAQPADEDPSTKRHKPNPPNPPVAQIQQQFQFPASPQPLQQRYAPQLNAPEIQPTGMAVDYTRMGQELIVQIMPYVISTAGGTSNGLIVNYSIMPPELIVAVARFAIPSPAPYPMAPLAPQQQAPQRWPPQAQLPSAGQQNDQGSQLQSRSRSYPSVMQNHPFANTPGGAQYPSQAQKRKWG